jgi:hypothetical protein
MARESSQRAGDVIRDGRFLRNDERSGWAWSDATAPAPARVRLERVDESSLIMDGQRSDKAAQAAAPDGPGQMCVWIVRRAKHRVSVESRES